jgi:hypothetical protein
VGNRLVSFRSGLVAPDVPEAVHNLERASAAIPNALIRFRAPKAGDLSWDAVKADPGITEMAPHLSMRPAGRELEIELELTSFEGPEAALGSAQVEALWGLAVPLGFMPWQRYPLVGSQSKVFHYLGPWASVIDSLHGEGRGEAAWPSACAAAQIDVGTWEGDRAHNIGVQAHLHRLGIPCGPVDGNINQRTLGCLKALGFGGQPMEDVLQGLERMQTTAPTTKERRNGQIIMTDCEAFSSGLVHTTKTNVGYAVTVDGPGSLTLIVSS